MATVDDLRKITYGVLVGFVVMLVVWISFLAVRGCGLNFNCAGAGGEVPRTPIPTLIPATQPAMNMALGAATAVPVVEAGGTAAATAGPTDLIPRPSNPGGPGPAMGLVGDAAAGKTIFEANCQICHNVEGKGGNQNPGSSDGTVPALNPIDPLLKSTDPKEFATNLDLFVEHGSTPAGPNPTLSMLAWGDRGLLMPQQIADVIAYVMQLNQ